MNRPDNPEELIKFVEDLKRQWMSTIDALVDPLAIIKPDYTIHKANLAMAKHAKKDVKDIVGQKCHQVFADSPTPCAGCTMIKTIESAHEEAFELEEINERFFEVTGQPLRDSNGKVYAAVHVYRDRTQAKNMREQLSQQEKLASIGLLAGGVAHEINNPLGGILIFSQMLLKEMDKESQHYPDVVEIEAATQRCKAIVNNLLEFARQQPLGKKENSEVDIKDAIESAIRFGKVTANANPDIEFEINLAEGNHFIHGNHNKLIQVFLNLIQNSVQAMPDGGILKISTTIGSMKEGGEVVIDISDQGVGIAPQNLKKIFDPFFTTKDPGEGTGLGLALSYGIIEDFGGSMSCKSKVNQGTTFTITLPLTEVSEKDKTA